MVASSAAWTTGGGYASWPPSLKIFRMSSAISRLVLSRPVRFAASILLVVLIVSPAVVVFAVVWTAPSDYQPVAATVDNEPARLLPAPDVQQGSLPPTAFNVYANTMSGVVQSPLCQIPARAYVPNSAARTASDIDPPTFKGIDHYPPRSLPPPMPP